MERFYACRNIAERKQPADAGPETLPLDYTHHQIQLRRITPHTTIYRNITRDLAIADPRQVRRLVRRLTYMNRHRAVTFFGVNISGGGI